MVNSGMRKSVLYVTTGVALGIIPHFLGLNPWRAEAQRSADRDIKNRPQLEIEFSELDRINTQGHWMALSGTASLIVLDISGHANCTNGSFVIVHLTAYVSGLGPVGSRDIREVESTMPVSAIGEFFDLEIRPRVGLGWGDVRTEADVKISGREAFQ